MPSSAIVELRQYTLHPNRRDDLVALFEREFIEPQEAFGISVIGQFRDLDDPQRFTWLRGFTDMLSREAGLQGFYSGPVWHAHRDAANATMIDSDDVLLLRPARPGTGFALTNARPGRDNGTPSKRLYAATICRFAQPVGDDVVAHFERTIAPEIARGGGAVCARFVTDASPNTFPALPIREGENVFAWFTMVPSQTAYEQHVSALNRSSDWRRAIGAFDDRLVAPLETRRLAPTLRSRLR